MKNSKIVVATAAVLTAGVASHTSPAAAQTDPAGFGAVINVPGNQNTISRGIGSDTQLNLSEGGSISSFFLAGSSDGDGSNVEVNISGGNVGELFNANPGSIVNISGGNVGALFNANFGSTVNISGGNVGSSFAALSDSTVNISGGTVGDTFTAESGSTVNLFGTSFLIDGAELTALVLGEAFTTTERDVTLSGVLADGSAFDFDLNSAFSDSQDYFDSGATLTVTLVPEPTSLALLGLGGLALATRRSRV